MNEEEEKPKRSILQLAFFGGSTRNTLIRVIVLVLLAVVVFGWVLRPIRVTGISMSPTYRDQSLNFVNLLSYKMAEPQRGDVVSVRVMDGGVHYMKRIIALPGEKVSINQGYVFVNGEPLDEPYVVFREKWMMPTQELTSDEFLIIGDNRGMAQEGHVFGIVRRDHVLGKVLF